MIEARTFQHATAFSSWLSNGLTLVYCFVVSALAMIEPMIAATFDSVSPVRQAAMLILLIFLMVLQRPRLLLTRELALYAAFTAYMFISLIWAPSIDDGMNTLLPALDFILLSILFGSLIAFHDLRAVIVGAVCGFVLGALAYTRFAGFPFSYPEDFSYNAIAGMYLGGLYITLIFGWYTRLRVLSLFIALVVMVLIAATTSIKTNLGIVLGVAAAALMYSRSTLRVFRRNLVLLSILASALVYGVVSNESLLDQVTSGLDRVSHGVEILQKREDVAGNTSFGDRTDWTHEGIKGWMRSPLFGSGVEAFRTDYGITSHSTPIDLLYNSGIVGFVLYYAIFISLALRLLRVRGLDLGGLPALIFGGLVCYSFITLSAAMGYNAFLAIFFAVSAGLLQRLSAHPPRESATVLGGAP